MFKFAKSLCDGCCELSKHQMSRGMYKICLLVAGGVCVCMWCMRGGGGEWRVVVCSLHHFIVLCECNFEQFDLPPKYCCVLVCAFYAVVC
jgi:hypothetical protein